MFPLIWYSGISTPGGLVLFWYPWQQPLCIYWKPHSNCGVSALSGGTSEIFKHKAYIIDIPALQTVFRMFLMKNLFLIPTIDFCNSCRWEIKYEIDFLIFFFFFLIFARKRRDTNKLNWTKLSFFFWFVCKRRRQITLISFVTLLCNSYEIFDIFP